ncbi:hypothetical protein PFISCL1PPCAC_25349, partial [Pristionchus fissidentatus]
QPLQQLQQSSQPLPALTLPPRQEETGLLIPSASPISAMQTLSNEQYVTTWLDGGSPTVAQPLQQVQQLHQQSAATFNPAALQPSDYLMPTSSATGEAKLPGSENNGGQSPATSSGSGKKMEQPQLTPYGGSATLHPSAHFLTARSLTPQGKIKIEEPNFDSSWLAGPSAYGWNLMQQSQQLRPVQHMQQLQQMQQVNPMLQQQPFTAQPYAPATLQPLPYPPRFNPVNGRVRPAKKRRATVADVNGRSWQLPSSGVAAAATGYSPAQ